MDYKSQPGIGIVHVVEVRLDGSGAITHVADFTLGNSSPYPRLGTRKDFALSQGSVESPIAEEFDLWQRTFVADYERGAFDVLVTTDADPEFGPKDPEVTRKGDASPADAFPDGG